MTKYGPKRAKSRESRDKTTLPSVEDPPLKLKKEGKFIYLCPDSD